MAAAHALAGRIAAAAPAAVSATLQMLRLQLPQHVLQEAALLEAKEQAGAVRCKRLPHLHFALVGSMGRRHGASSSKLCCAKDRRAGVPLQDVTNDRCTGKDAYPEYGRCIGHMLVYLGF
jgi:hypothetical protein